MKEPQEILTELNEKIDIVIKLLALNALSPSANQTEAIYRLDKVGLKPKQIAEVLNTTQNYVNVILSKKRRVKKNG